MLIDFRAIDSRAFVKGLSKLMDSTDNKVNMTLLEDTLTGVSGKTHYVVIGGSSLDEVLNSFRDT